jgi:thiamine-monophosphate kinase
MRNAAARPGTPPNRLDQLGELGLVQRIRESSPISDPTGVRTGIGDDTAVLAVAPGALLLATTDLVIEDIHFRRAWASPRDIGWKAMAVNLSDIAAMGGRPRWALVGLALPASMDVDAIDILYAGMREAAEPYGVTIVGGDCSASPDRWMIDVTLLGEHLGRPRLRSMAESGDAVIVTGSLGRSAAGLALLELEGATAAAVSPQARAELVAAHLRPTPRVAEGEWLGAQASVHAMMDVSDGIATDLGHICRESRTGARVMLDRLPLTAATREAARVQARDPIQWATGGGEDYELLVTCAPDAVDALSEGLRRATGTALTVIGQIDPGEPGIRFVDARGETVTLPSGYGHFGG